MSLGTQYENATTAEKTAYTKSVVQEFVTTMVETVNT